MAPVEQDPFAADLDLARRAAGGEPEAVIELDALCTRVLGRAARNLAHVTADADDLLQEAKAHVMQPAVLAKYRGTGPLAGFLRIAGMRAMAIVERRTDRRNWRQRVTYGLEAAPLSFHDADLDAVEGRADPELHAALAELPERARQVLVAIAVLDLSYREASLALGIPIGTVGSTYNRARASLQAQLSQHPAASEGERRR